MSNTRAKQGSPTCLSLVVVVVGRVCVCGQRGGGEGREGGGEGGRGGRGPKKSPHQLVSSAAAGPPLQPGLTEARTCRHVKDLAKNCKELRVFCTVSDHELCRCTNGHVSNLVREMLEKTHVLHCLHHETCRCIKRQRTALSKNTGLPTIKENTARKNRP